MTKNHINTLNKDKALIFRIVHIDNIPWILMNGLHCGNSMMQSESWIHIGNRELIDKRSAHSVPIGKKGVLNDYVPFYFTPFSPMLLNLKTGRGGVERRSNQDIVVLVSSLKKLQLLELDFVFTDSHANYNWANFYNDLQCLDKIDWAILQNKDFQRDPDDPGKFERYQAEALVYQRCPVSALLGLVCYNDVIKKRLQNVLAQNNVDLQVYTRSGWYF